MNQRLIGSAILLLLGAASAAAQTGGNQWSESPGVPLYVGLGGTVVATDADTLYVAVGADNYIGARPDFYRYSIPNRSWATMAPVPAPVGQGGAMAHLPDTTRLYLLRGSNSSDFLEYDIPTNAWRPLASGPSGSTGSHLFAAGSSLYALIGNRIWHYLPDPVGLGTWTPKAHPGVGGTFAAAAYPGTGDIIYVAHNTTNFFSTYSISGDSWGIAALPRPPTGARDHESFMMPGPGNSLLFINGTFFEDSEGIVHPDGALFQYDVAADTWTFLAGLPGEITSDVSIAWAPDGDSDTVTISPGGQTALWKYSLGGEAFVSTLASAPWPIGQRGAITGVGDGDSLYVLMADGPMLDPSLFYRYSVDGNTWTGRANTPGVFGRGTSLAWTGGDHIYAAAGGGGGDFCRYSISGNSWDAGPLASIPGQVSQGGRIVHGGSNRIYGVLGEGTTGIYLYTLPDGPNPQGRWEQKSTLPAGEIFRAGMNLCYPGSGDFLYVVQGGSSKAFRRCSISGNAWSQAAELPETPGQGFSLCRPGSSPYIYGFRGNGTSTFWAYWIEGDRWISKAPAPGSPIPTQSMVHLGGSAETLYAVPGLSNALWRYSFANDPPTAIGSTQVMPETGQLVLVGGENADPEMGFAASLGDLNGDLLRLEVEIRPKGSPFTGAATGSSAWVTGGVTTFSVALSPGQFRWRYRAKDSAGGSSEWSDFGANGPEETDFTILAPPPPPPADSSEGNQCALSAAGDGLIAGAWVFAAFIVVISRRKGLKSAAIGAAVLALACGGDGGGGSAGGGGVTTPDLPTVTHAITPAISWVVVGGTCTLDVTGPISGEPEDLLAWESLDPRIARVDPDGKVTGVAVGRTTIAAFPSTDPALRATAAVIVTPGASASDILAVGPGLYLYPWVSRPGKAGRTPDALHHSTLNQCRGIASVPGGKVYVLSGYGIWCVDLLAGSATLEIDIATGAEDVVAGFGNMGSLAVDSRGRLYTIGFGGAGGDMILRYDPSTGDLAPFAEVPNVGLALGLDIDSNDNLYVHGAMLMGSPSVVTRISPAGVPTNVLPNYDGHRFGAGLSVVGDGSMIYVAVQHDIPGDTLDYGIYRCLDLDGDGIYDDVTLCAGGFGKIGGIFWTGDGLIVNGMQEQGVMPARILALKDANADGFYSGGEITDWAFEPVDGNSTRSVFARFKP